MKRPRQPTPGALILVHMLTSIAFAAGLVWYIDWSGERDDRRWCEVMVLFDRAYEANPPTTELGRRIAAGMHRLRGKFGCE